MLLSLRSLNGAHEHFDKRYDPSLFSEVEGDTFRVVAPVVLSFDVDNEETGRFRVVGQAKGDLELACSRCLEPFTLPVAPEFDLRYESRVENAGEGEKEVEEDDLATSFYSDNQIDLGQLILEQVHLALPMKPLRTTACKGLCRSAARTWTPGRCECEPEWIDPRWKTEAVEESR